nr:MAG TPA: hypothetical protein [Caudoviricetes sp.]
MTTFVDGSLTGTSLQQLIGNTKPDFFHVQLEM